MGIRTVDGTPSLRCLVCVAGFSLSHWLAWLLLGQHGINLAEQWKDEPEAYFSLAAIGFPKLCRCS